jgi:hypothetical protein
MIGQHKAMADGQAEGATGDLGKDSLSSWVKGSSSWWLSSQRRFLLPTTSTLA